MKTRVLLFLFFTITIFALGTVISILFNTAPTSREIIALLYFALFTTIFGVVFFAVYSFHYLRQQAIPSWQSTLTAVRLGLVIGLLVDILLAIRSVNLLNTATFIILVLIAVAAELLLRKRTLGRTS